MQDLVLLRFDWIQSPVADACRYFINLGNVAGGWVAGRLWTYWEATEEETHYPGVLEDENHDVMYVYASCQSLVIFRV